MVPPLTTAAVACSGVLPSKFKVKQYCPLVFRDLRLRFSEEADMYLVRPGSRRSGVVPRLTRARQGVHVRRVARGDGLDRRKVPRLHLSLARPPGMVSFWGIRVGLPR